jgi:uncharacterized protein
MAPYFRQNHYYEGLVAGVGAIATLLNQEKFPAPKAKQQPAQQNDLTTILFGFGPFILIGVGILLIVFRRRGGPPIYPSGPQQHSNWESGAAGFILGNILSEASRRNSGWGGGGGFDGGFGGGSSGGGFSGGGGSFDGGGASGDW